MRWIARDGDPLAVPLVGKYAHMMRTVILPSTQMNGKISRSMLKDLLNGIQGMTQGMYHARSWRLEPLKVRLHTQPPPLPPA